MGGYQELYRRGVGQFIVVQRALTRYRAHMVNSFGLNGLDGEREVFPWLYRLKDKRV
jgi:hypothetical protein